MHKSFESSSPITTNWQLKLRLKSFAIKVECCQPILPHESVRGLRVDGPARHPLPLNQPIVQISRDDELNSLIN